MPKKLEVKHEEDAPKKDFKVPCGCDWCGKPKVREPIFCDEECKQQYEARH